jgi:hypothetical protein
MPEDKIKVYEKYTEAYKTAHRWVARVLVATAAIIILESSCGTLIGLRNKRLDHTPKYESVAALKAGFEEQKKKLGLEDKTIFLEMIQDPNFKGSCRYEPNDTYYIRIGENHMNKGVLDHEMFHARRIKDKRIKPGQMQGFSYFYEEWLATSYALKESEHK